MKKEGFVGLNTGFPKVIELLFASLFRGRSILSRVAHPPDEQSNGERYVIWSRDFVDDKLNYTC